MKRKTPIREDGSEGFVTAKYIADFYSVTSPTIFRWAREKRIPSVSFEGTIRFNFEAVREAIEGKGGE